MGNQNTSGIVGEEEAKNEGRDEPKVENQMMDRENAAEGEVGKIPKDVEDDEGCVEGSDDMMDIETNGSDLREGRSKLSDEEQDQPCTFTVAELEMQNPSPKCTSDDAESTATDIQEQNVLVKETVEVDNDLDAEKNDADLASVEGEDVGKDDEYPQEEQSISISTINEAPRISLLYSSTPENELINEHCSSPDHEEIRMIQESAGDEAENECSDYDHEEKPMINELVKGDHTNNTICVDTDQEMKSSDPITEAGFKENEDDPLEEVAEKLDENKATDGNVFEDVECEPSPAENGHETTEKCVLELQSSMEIDTAGAKVSPISKGSESKAESDAKTLETEENQSYSGAKVELQKSPSFDFGISFDTRSEDSDQTPLLYQDKTARRSLSTCSNLSFQSTSIQKEYAAKPLQFEAVQVEEKIVQMERSNSKTPSSQVIKNNQENGSIASPTRDGGADISSKGNRRRKPRSSLLTACICCTAAIS